MRKNKRYPIWVPFIFCRLKNRQASATHRITGFRVTEYRTRNYQIFTIWCCSRNHAADYVEGTLYRFGKVINLPIRLASDCNTCNLANRIFGLRTAGNYPAGHDCADGCSIRTKDVHFVWTQINEIHDNYLLISVT